MKTKNVPEVLKWKINPTFFFDNRGFPKWGGGPPLGNCSHIIPFFFWQWPYIKWLWIVLRFTVSLFPSGSVYIANQTRKFICYAEQRSKVICYLLLSPKSIIRGRGPQIPMHANATFCPQKQFLHCIRPTHRNCHNCVVSVHSCGSG